MVESGGQAETCKAGFQKAGNAVLKGKGGVVVCRQIAGGECVDGSDAGACKDADIVSAIFYFAPILIQGVFAVGHDVGIVPPACIQSGIKISGHLCGLTVKARSEFEHIRGYIDIHTFFLEFPVCGSGRCWIRKLNPEDWSGVRKGIAINLIFIDMQIHRHGRSVPGFDGVESAFETMAGRFFHDAAGRYRHDPEGERGVEQEFHNNCFHV